MSTCHFVSLLMLRLNNLITTALIVCIDDIVTAELAICIDNVIVRNSFIYLIFFSGISPSDSSLLFVDIFTSLDNHFCITIHWPLEIKSFKNIGKTSGSRFRIGVAFMTSARASTTTSLADFQKNLAVKENDVRVLCVGD